MRARPNTASTSAKRHRALGYARRAAFGLTRADKSHSPLWPGLGPMLRFSVELSDRSNSAKALVTPKGSFPCTVAVSRQLAYRVSQLLWASLLRGRAWLRLRHGAHIGKPQCRVSGNSLTLCASGK